MSGNGSTMPVPTSMIEAALERVLAQALGPQLDPAVLEKKVDDFIARSIGIISVERAAIEFGITEQTMLRLARREGLRVFKCGQKINGLLRSEIEGLLKARSLKLSAGRKSSAPVADAA